VAIDREKVQANAQKFVDKKKYDKAIAELLKITQEEPNDARTLLKIGDLYSKVPDFPNAIATYERVAKLYAQQGFALKAIAVYKQIREMLVKHAPQLESRYAHITPLLADLFQQLGLVSDALAALDEYASALQRQQKDAEALDVLRRIVELDPTNPLPHLRLAEALSRMKDAEAAVQEFGDAASLLVKLGRRDDAIKVFERLLHLKPDVGFARQCAELYLDRGLGQDGMLALAKLQLCFQADPKDLNTLALLARAFGAIGQANKGIEVQKEMARLAKEQGNLDLFHQLIEKLLRVAPNDEQVRAMSMASSRLPSAASYPAVTAPAQPVIREAPQETARAAPPSGRGSVDEPSYQQVDSQEFVDDAEIEEVTEDSIASRRSGRLQAAAPAYVIEEEEVIEPPPQPAAPARRAAFPPQNEHNETTRFVPPQQRVVDTNFNDSTEINRPRVALPSEPRLEIEEESIELDEAGSSDDDDEIRQAVGQALADAASFKRVKLFAKALESLQTGLELDPMSREVHEAIRDIYVETGQYDEAAGHVVVISGMQLESGDVDGAVQSLYDALTLRPGLQQAEEMLQSLGYELPVYGDPNADPNTAATTEGSATQPPQARRMTSRPPSLGAPRFATEPPLPAYPLPDDLPPPTSRPSDMQTDEGLHAREDDGYGAGEAPLPSFPMAGESEPAFDLVQSKTSRPPADDDGRPDATPTAELEEVLEEADFFASRGLFDDARTILTEQLALHPRHVLLNERLAELDAQEQAARDASGPREPPRAGPTFDRSFDIAASLDAIENLDTTGAMATGGFSGADDQVDVEEVFAAFKEGVAKQVSIDDAQSHYDLGVAYKEMGLLDDAIREFEVAARDEKRDCVCRSMVGMIQMERGKVPEAIEAFQRGLAASIKTEEQEMVLCFEIGAGYEAMSRTKDALTYFDRVVKIDPTYRDVVDRIRRLKGRGGPKPPPAAPAARDDDFDRAFDDMLGDGPSKTGSSD
jgi:tetratricopeptide (TPR) repeat protein